MNLLDHIHTQMNYLVEYLPRLYLKLFFHINHIGNYIKSGKRRLKELKKDWIVVEMKKN